MLLLILAGLCVHMNKLGVAAIVELVLLYFFGGEIYRIGVIVTVIA